MFKSISIKALIVFCFITIFIGQKLTEYDRWNNVDKVIKADIKGYYAYLPAYFIDKDITFKNKRPNAVNKYIWTQQFEDKKLIKYSCGVAILQTPMFILAHQYAKSSDDYEPNGYSVPYSFSIVITTLIFLLIGLIYCRKLLLLYFSENVSLITIISLFLSTNVLAYYFDIISMSHIYSISILFVYIYYSIHWLRESTIKSSIIIGLSLSLLILIRPIDILFFPIPFLLSINKTRKLIQIVSYTFANYKALFISILSGVLVFIPQLLYNYTISGKLIFYTYTDEGFFFLNPQIYKSIFSFRNGWLIYSPILVFAIFGLVLLVLKNKLKWGLYVLIIALYIYIISSWWCWWYVGFGNRAFINLLPLLSIPFAYFVKQIINKPWYIKLVFGVVLYLFVNFNFFQISKYKHGSIHYSAMSSAAYWNSYNSIGTKELFEIYLEPLETKLAKKGIYKSRKQVFDTTYTRIITFNDQEFEKKDLSFKIPLNSANRVYVKAKGSTNFYIVAKGDSITPFESFSGEVLNQENNALTIHHWVRLNGYQGDSLTINIWNKDQVDLKIESIDITAINYTIK